jgi:hypothetical protein
MNAMTLRHNFLGDPATLRAQRYESVKEHLRYKYREMTNAVAWRTARRTNAHFW